MRKLKRAVLAELYRAAVSPNLYLAILLFAFIQYINVFDEIKSAPASTVYYLYIMRDGLGGISLLTILLSGVPHAGSTASDMKHKYLLYNLKRSNFPSYCIAKILVSALTAILMVLSGYLLFILLTHLTQPAFPQGKEELDFFLQTYRNPFSSLASGKNSMLFYIASSIPEAMCAAMLSAVVLFLSAFTTNLFVLYSAPLFSFYFTLYIIDFLGLPDILCWTNYMYDGFFANQTPIKNILATAGYYGIGILAFSVLFVWALYRRIYGEKYKAVL